MLLQQANAQALVITILVISFLSTLIFYVMFIVSNSGKTIVYNALYNQGMIYAEGALRNYVDRLRNSIDLSSLENDGFCLSLIDKRKYLCETEVSVKNKSAKIFTEIEDTKSLNLFSLQRDESYIMYLNGYKSDFIMDLYSDIAIEFSIIFDDFINRTKNRLSTLFDDNNHVLSVNNLEFFDIFDSPRNNALKTFKLNVTDLFMQNGFNIDQVSPKFLLVIPRSNIDNVRTARFNLFAENNAMLPYQIRDIKVKLQFIDNNIDTPVITLSTQMPLNYQFENIFFYNIFLEGGI